MTDNDDDSNDTTTTDAKSADGQHGENPPIFTGSAQSIELEFEDGVGDEPGVLRGDDGGCDCKLCQEDRDEPDENPYLDETVYNSVVKIWEDELDVGIDADEIVEELSDPTEDDDSEEGGWRDKVPPELAEVVERLCDLTMADPEDILAAAGSEYYRDSGEGPADPDLLLEAATELETLQRALLQELGDNVTPGDVRPDDNWYAGYAMARKLREAAGCTCDPGSDDACDTCGGRKGGGRV